MSIIWFFIAAVAAALPIIFIKKYTETKHCCWIIFAILIHFVVLFAYSIILSNKNISIMYPTLKVLSIICVAVIGVLCFNDKLTIPNIFGIILGIMCIYLLSEF